MKTEASGNPAAGKLQGRVALVAGATRGVGRGIALALAEGGATVYCTGRSSRGKTEHRGRALARASKPARKGWPEDYYSNRPEKVEDTAEMVSARGGKGIAVVADHLDCKLVEQLLSRIRKEQGRLDILVNDISESAKQEFGKPFWDLDIEKGFAMMRNAINTHIATSHFGAPLMTETAKRMGVPGLIVEIGDGDSYSYRGNLFYDVIKTTVIRLAFAMARELRRRDVAAVALTPGFLRSEVMLEQFGVTEANWKDAVKENPDYIASETPIYAGRAVACLAADPNIMQKSGHVFSSWTLSDEYGFADADGSRPHWGNYARQRYGDCFKPCDDGFYKYWHGGPIDTIWPNWP